MTSMMTPRPRQDANASEKLMFTAIERIANRSGWVTIHSLDLTDNLFTIAGESAFLVLAPGKGIVVIETKAPKYVEYKDGEWYLDRTPNPNKSFIEQLDITTSTKK